MMKPSLLFVAAALCAPAAIGVAFAQQAQPSYTAAQAEQGAALYQEKCTSCHGAGLGAGEFGPSLKGTRFKHDWGGKPASALFAYLTHNMPPGDAGSVPPEQHAQLLAYILQGNGVAPGTTELPSNAEAIKGMVPQ
jgi:cytochrome c